MDKSLDSILEGFRFHKRGDTDWFDRVCSTYSAGICLMFAFILGGGQLIGVNMICYTPTELDGQWSKYVHDYCWMKNTYRLLPSGKLPEHSHRTELELRYYQWVPLMLSFQALLFLVPGLLWQVFSSGGICDTNNLVKKSMNAAISKGRKGNIFNIAIYLDKVLGLNQTKRSLHSGEGFSNLFGCGKTRGNYTAILYLFTKLLYMGMALAQLYAMEVIISEQKGGLFGVQAMPDILSTDMDSSASRVFPKVTFCDFEVRRFGGNTHKYTVQCALPWNLYIEKMYVFLWLWLVVITLLSLVSLITWAISLLTYQKNRFVQYYLSVSGRVDPNGLDMVTKDKIHSFINYYLRLDGLFLLRMIATHTNPGFTADLTCALFNRYLTHSRNQRSPFVRLEDDGTSEEETGIGESPAYRHSQDNISRASANPLALEEYSYVDNDVLRQGMQPPFELVNMSDKP